MACSHYRDPEVGLHIHEDFRSLGKRPRHAMRLQAVQLPMEPVPAQNTTELAAPALKCPGHGQAPQRPAEKYRPRKRSSPLHGPRSQCATARNTQRTQHCGQRSTASQHIGNRRRTQRDTGHAAPIGSDKQRSGTLRTSGPSSVSSSAWGPYKAQSMPVAERGISAFRRA